MSYFMSLIIGYIFGNFQTSYILAKSTKQIDIREHGSGNAGSTNALRVMGKKFGIMTFGGDLFKAILAVLLTQIIFQDHLAGLYAGLGTVLGHNWPAVLRFKGGKGIASTLGTLLAFNLLLGLGVWLITAIVIFTTKYVSVGSIVLVTLFPITVALFYPDNIQALIIAMIFMVMGVYQHRANILRLLNGNENKLGQKKMTEASKGSH